MRRAGTLLAVLTVWEAAARLGWISALLTPPPTQILEVLLEALRRGQIWPHLAVTLTEAVGGLLLGLAAGAVLGLGAALLPAVAEVLQPAMTLLNAIPRVILAPLFVIWFGIGAGSKVALSFLLVAVTVFFAVYSGIRHVDPRLIDRVRTLGGGGRDVIREVYLPSVMGWLLSSLKIAVGFAFTGAVVGEFVASSRGLGYLLSFAQSTYNAAMTIALIVVVVAVTFVIFMGFECLERAAFRWRRPRRAAGSLE
ncbi:MAG: ABC transporter permease [Armatimonadota bacterium]|nr:ABC transporter permease [Armatimonadota bacterium]MDR7451338.1 ABC transporter permease [Armatimonadota bacterium]MDR7466758.1 ABC transporter permease [Armatimonadota bacterium]MDR7492768.1 ABC transporter permease [Armatimonadota bacterium]MDR7498544.1 ABC transporter permease [Armatimonadota bacterium]